MSIYFSINHEDGYYISRYTGKISDTDLLEAYKNFFSGEEWIPGLNELADLSEVDATEVTSKGLRILADQIYLIFKKHNLSPYIAAYAPSDLSYGLAKMYAVDAERFETYRVYRTLEEAEDWLKRNKKDEII